MPRRRNSFVSMYWDFVPQTTNPGFAKISSYGPDWNLHKKLIEKSNTLIFFLAKVAHPVNGCKCETQTVSLYPHLLVIDRIPLVSFGIYTVRLEYIPYEVIPGWTYVCWFNCHKIAVMIRAIAKFKEPIGYYESDSTFQRTQSSIELFIRNVFSMSN